RQRHGRTLFDDAGWLVLIAALPRDPDAERGNDQSGDGDQLAKVDQTPAGAGFGGFAHRPPASNSRRGAASSQLAAIRSATWSQSTSSPDRLIEIQPA